jgi:hypothetical protein
VKSPCPALKGLSCDTLRIEVADRFLILRARTNGLRPAHALSLGVQQRTIKMLSVRPCVVSALFVAFLLVGRANVSNANAQNESLPASTDWSRAETVQVVMTNYAFTPNALQFRSNTPYHLRLVSNSGHGHSFAASDFFAAVGIAPEDRSRVVAGVVEVEGGQVVDVKIVPARSGSYKFHCSHFLHSTFGMTGEALIQ